MSSLQTQFARIDEEFLKQYEELDLPGQASVLPELIKRFLKGSPQRLATVGEAIKKNEPATLRHEAHALKNTVANVGAAALADLCHSLEMTGDENKMAIAERLFQDVSKEYVEVVHELEKRLIQFR